MDDELKQLAAESIETPAKISDEDLAQLVAAGNAAALEQLYDRYSRQAMALAYRIVLQAELAEEIVQETFLKFWQQPEFYQPHRGRFITWFLSVVHHRSLNERKRSAFRLNLSADAPLQNDTGENLTLGNLLPDERQLDLYEEVWQRLQREQMRLALNRLNPDQRRAIELAYFEGLNQQEIAQKVGVPLGTIKTRIRLGLQKLRTNLETEETKGTLTAFSAQSGPASSL